MYIGSSYNIKNKISSNPILINNVPVPRTGTYTCLGISLDERLTWKKHIDTICAKVGAGIEVMKRIEAFCTSRNIKANLRSPCTTIFQLLQSPLGQLWNWSQR